MVLEINQDIIDGYFVTDAPMDFDQDCLDSSFQELLEQHGTCASLHQKAFLVNQIYPIGLRRVHDRKVSAHERVDAAGVHKMDPGI
ncbi:hypothetical protein [Pseudacidovorax intermedius]|uniref:Uncharacterized protein n=1 Tax=Pseudacidovorax intermedius TaxID=433924 RepID=A0A147GYR9_9BURK|nr:hypothetical protein [Pseudacidovorax intermedius]KTT22530.1 hypothetical protein NS331_09665 [Pseudacidovorax intermedius]